MSLLPTSSSGQAAAEVAVVVAAHRDTEQDPVEPGAPGVVREAAPSRSRPRCSASSPQRMPASATQPVIRARSSSVNRNRRPDRVGRREVEHLGGGDPAAGELDQRGRHGEQRVGAGERAVGEPDPQPVGRVARRPSTTSASPKPAEISGA